jgi:hypothetical protein
MLRVKVEGDCLKTLKIYPMDKYGEYKELTELDLIKLKEVFGSLKYDAHMGALEITFIEEGDMVEVRGREYSVLLKMRAEEAAREFLGLTKEEWETLRLAPRVRAITILR